MEIPIRWGIVMTLWETFIKLFPEKIGFKYQPNDHYYYPEAGKTMGLASYGDDRYYSEINKFIKYGNNGELSILLSDGKLAKNDSRYIKTRFK